MLVERDRILADAQTRAQQITAHAEQQALQMVSEHAITARSHDEAERIITHGHAEATRMIDEAEAYALDVLYRLREQLSGSLRQADNGIQAIESSQPSLEDIEDGYGDKAGQSDWQSPDVSG